MPDHDAGLARIDSMLEDYIPPSHLPLVLTPEEAELLGQEPISTSYDRYLTVADFIPPRHRGVSENTHALLERASRSRHGNLEAEIMAMIIREMRRRVPEAYQVFIRADPLDLNTYVIVETSYVQFRWLARTDYWAMHYQHKITLSIHSMRSRGCDWMLVRQDQQALAYAVAPEYLLSRWSDREAVPASLERRTLDTTPYEVVINEEVLRGTSVRGARVLGAWFDEMVDTFAQIGVAARVAAQTLNALPESTITEREEETLPAVIPAPVVRPGLDGQRSPYGPPPRGRRR